MENPVELVRAEADDSDTLAEAGKMALEMPQEFAKEASVTKERVSKLYRLMVFTRSIHQQMLILWIPVTEACQSTIQA